MTFSFPFTDSFPGDPSYAHGSRITPGVLYSWVQPTHSPEPQILHSNPALLKDLQIPEPWINPAYWCGNLLPPGAKTYATRYGGHQFGHFAGQLGDGRAINLGFLTGQDTKKYEIQLKGAGPTPYSRSGDGYAVLRSSVREYLMSEAMFRLGVPSSRALFLIKTQRSVVRDPFYDGHPQNEPGAVVTRVAPHFIRFGHFEILAASGEWHLLNQLIDWTLKKEGLSTELSEYEKKKLLLDYVSQKTLGLIGHWLRVGFVHGVMNTDNMSINGITLDYGPFAFLEKFDLSFTPNTTDLPGRRYSFGNQARVALWNLSRLAMALFASPQENQNLDFLEEFFQILELKFESLLHQILIKKIGLADWGRNPSRLRVNDSVIGVETHTQNNQELKKLAPLLVAALTEIGADYTLFFIKLRDWVITGSEDLLNSQIPGIFNEVCYPTITVSGENKLIEFIKHYQEVLAQGRKQNPEFLSSVTDQMQSINPSFILRNSHLYECIQELEQGDDKKLKILFEILQNPYHINGEHKAYYQKSQPWAFSTKGCSQLSCSS